MIGKITWNLYISLVGMVLTFFFNFAHNLFLTSLIRSVYVFVCLFLLGFLVRFLLGIVFSLNSTTNESIAEEAGKGSFVDMTTPDDEEIDESDSEFKPLEVPQTEK